jgi:hypothetical protein
MAFSEADAPATQHCRARSAAVREPFPARPALTGMSDSWPMLAFLAGWVLLQWVVLPRLGVRT